MDHGNNYHLVLAGIAKGNSRFQKTPFDTFIGHQINSHLVGGIMKNGFLSGLLSLLISLFMANASLAQDYCQRDSDCDADRYCTSNKRCFPRKNDDRTSSNCICTYEQLRNGTPTGRTCVSRGETIREACASANTICGSESRHVTGACHSSFSFSNPELSDGNKYNVVGVGYGKSESEASNEAQSQVKFKTSWYIHNCEYNLKGQASLSIGIPQCEERNNSIRYRCALEGQATCTK
jgi:hypothetical protein